MHTVAGLVAALLIVVVLLVPSIAGVATWKVALALVGLALVVLSGRTKSAS